MKPLKQDAKKLIPTPSSFRDPKGRVAYDQNDEIYRILYKTGHDSFMDITASGLYDHLTKTNKLIAHEQIEIEKDSNIPNAYLLLKHPRIPVISYPYEWSFEQLKDAALLQIELYIESLSFGKTLTDATAYNVQFIGHKPIFIDTLSFVTYNDGTLWLAQQQFTEQFLNPLLLVSYAQLSFNEIYRGSMTGIGHDFVHATTPLNKKLSWKYFNYIYLPLLSNKRLLRMTNSNKKTIKGLLPKEGFLFILKQLKAWIEGLKNPQSDSVWYNYTKSRLYTEENLNEKKEFVSEIIKKIKPELLIDLGCNTGEFSLLSLESGAKYVVGLEYDLLSLSIAYKRSIQENLAFLPLHQNIINPSPSQGWSEKERNSLKDRISADFLLCLAIIHHISIAGNVPLNVAINYLVSLAPKGIIEWVPKSDTMVKTLLCNREDIFDNYNQDIFENSLNESGARITKKKELTNGRVLYFYQTSKP